MRNSDDKRFCVFILTYGRANNVLTVSTLRRQGFTGKIFLVVGKDDAQLADYVKAFGEKNVVVFDKESVCAKSDTMDNFGRKNIVLFARNTVFDIAKKMGYKFFLVLDDDYTNFNFCFDSERRFVRRVIRNLDNIFQAYVNFLERTKICCVAFAQGGDFIGGGAGNRVNAIKCLPKAMNSFFFATGTNERFLGTINEDVNFYVKHGNRGKIILTPNAIALNQIQTQKNAHGLTDIYLTLGTFVKSFYSVIINPSAVKVFAMGFKEKRLHHKVDSNKAFPKIVRAGQQ